MFFVAMPYLMVFKTFDLKVLGINLFALIHDDNIMYISFSWYVKVYLEFLLVLPIVKKITNNISNPIIDGCFFILIPLLVSTQLPDSEKAFVGVKIFLLSSVKLLCTWLPLFYTGIMVNKYSYAQKLKEGLDKCAKQDHINRKIFNVTMIMPMLTSILLRYTWKLGWMTDVVCVTIFSMSFYVVDCNIKSSILSEVLKTLGKYSFYTWLLSGMFFLNTTQFQWILFLPRYSILVLIWTFVILLPCAVLMSKITDKIEHVGNSVISCTGGEKISSKNN